MFLNEFTYLRKSDRLAIIGLLVVAVVCLVLLLTLGGRSQEAPSPLAKKDSVATQRYAARTPKTYTYAVEGQRVERFPFDPNTADSTTLLRLGLQPWQVQNIYKYRAKGGIYREPADFARVYGLTAGQWRELEPYIRIGEDYRPVPAQEIRSHAEAPADTTHRSYKIRENERVDLNEADTTLLMRVPGIGSYFARQIVRERERLGGFSNVAQLQDIDGFPEQAMHYFVIAEGNVRQLNVNTLSLKQLRRHPYINFYQARAITDYKRLKGRINGLDDLRRLPEFTDKDIERLAPYLSF